MPVTARVPVFPSVVQIPATRKRANVGGEITPAQKNKKTLDDSQPMPNWRSLPRSPPHQISPASGIFQPENTTEPRRRQTRMGSGKHAPTQTRPLQRYRYCYPYRTPSRQNTLGARSFPIGHFVAEKILGTTGVVSQHSGVTLRKTKKFDNWLRMITSCRYCSYR